MSRKQPHEIVSSGVPRPRYPWARWIAMWFVVGGLYAAASSDGEDWPQWRGPTRDGVWRESGIANELPEGQLPLKWSIEIGAGYSGPTVASGRVYITDRLVNANDGQVERVICVDERTGERIWEHRYAATYTISYTAGPRASVTVHDGLAYAVGAMGHFHCLDAATGKVIWQHDLNREYEIDMPIWGIAGAPLVFEDLVIQQVGGTEGRCIVAFDRRTGAEVWHALNDRAGYSSPMLIEQGGQPVLVCWTGDSLSGLNPRNGQVHWSHPFPPSRMPIGIAMPVLDGELLFVTSFYDGSLMVRVPRDAIKMEVVWREVGPSEQETLALHGMIGTPIMRGGYVYGADSYGEFRCLNARTGERIWEDLTAVPKARWATVHAVENGDRIWMFNERGELLITKLSPEGLTIFDRAKLIEPTTAQLNQRGGVCWSHPAFANRCVYARNDKRMVCASLERSGAAGKQGK